MLVFKSRIALQRINICHFNYALLSFHEWVTVQLHCVPKYTKTTLISMFCSVFRIFVVSECRDFKFGGHVAHIKPQPTDDKQSLKGTGHVT